MRWLCSLTRIFLSSVVSAKMSVFIFKDGRNIRRGIFSRFLGVPKLRSVNCSKSMKNWRGEFYYTKKKAKAPLQQKTLKMFLGGNGAVCSAFLCTQRIYSTGKMALLRPSFRQPRHEGKNSNTSTVTEYNVVEKSLSFQNARVRNFPRSSSKVKADPRTASRVWNRREHQ